MGLNLTKCGNFLCLLVWPSLSTFGFLEVWKGQLVCKELGFGPSVFTASQHKAEETPGWGISGSQYQTHL